MGKPWLICYVIACWRPFQAAWAWNLPRADRSSTGSDSTLCRGRFLDSSCRIATGAIVGAGVVPQTSYAMTTDPKTGISLPSVGEIESAIPSSWDDVDNPFDSDGKSQFARLDSKPDSIFYSDPQFVEHVDENAVRSMTNYISKEAIRPGDTVLDLCSSWSSHIDGSISRPEAVVGDGMNEKELSSNPSLTSWNVQDVNKNPRLPYKDKTFSVVLCQLSIDYLTRPLEVMKEVGRVLQPGGTVHILFSNRLFLSKVS